MALRCSLSKDPSEETNCLKRSVTKRFDIPKKICTFISSSCKLEHWASEKIIIFCGVSWYCNSNLTIFNICCIIGLFCSQYNFLRFLWNQSFQFVFCYSNSFSNFFVCTMFFYIFNSNIYRIRAWNNYTLTPQSEYEVYSQNLLKWQIYILLCHGFWIIWVQNMQKCSCRKSPALFRFSSGLHNHKIDDFSCNISSITQNKLVAIIFFWCSNNRVSDNSAALWS